MALAPIALIAPNFSGYANYWLKSYEQGTTTPLSMYTDSGGGTAMAKAEINTNGFIITSGSALVIPWINGDYDLWLFSTEALADANDTSSALQLADDLDADPYNLLLGRFDTRYLTPQVDGTYASEWKLYGSAPSFISTVSFSVTGDQTTDFHVGRRVKTVNTGGTVYSTITASVYSSVTTVTVANDSGTIDSGISALYYSVLSSIDPSVPKIALPNGSTGETQSAGDNSSQIATTAYVDSQVALSGGSALFGCTTSNGTDNLHDIDISAGSASDSTNSYLLTVSAAIGKQIDNNWAEGGTPAATVGGFPSGLTLTNDTWYGIFLIGKTDGTVNAGYDISSTASNLFSDAIGYTLYRQIGLVYRTAGQNLQFSQLGDSFIYDEKSL